MKDGTVGATAERQLRQIEYTRRGEIFVSADLRGQIEALGKPMYFIDFETSRLALPYHHGMRPYGLVAFQWSCHKVASHGQQPTHAEWLNKTDVWPNRLFVESLREAIGDSGAVLTWSPFEGTTLNQIIPELAIYSPPHAPLGKTRASRGTTNTDSPFRSASSSNFATGSSTSITFPLGS